MRVPQSLAAVALLTACQSAPEGHETFESIAETAFRRFSEASEMHPDDLDPLRRESSLILHQFIQDLDKKIEVMPGDQCAYMDFVRNTANDHTYTYLRVSTPDASWPGHIQTWAFDDGQWGPSDIQFPCRADQVEGHVMIIPIGTQGNVVLNECSNAEEHPVPVRCISPQ